MPADIDGQAALVTGASAGIGAATARALAREGADVALAARSEDRLADLAAEVESEFGVETVVAPTDVRDEDAVAKMVETAADALGGLDVVVNNAGTAHGMTVEHMSTEDYRTTMETNVDGMFFTTREVVPHLRESSGTLVFIGSFAGKFPRPYNPVYAASKWWTRGFAKSVSSQVGTDDVGVTVINPSEVRSEFGEAYGETFEERFDEGEVSEPEEIAEAVVFAAEQSPSMASEIDIFRRDKFELFGTM